MKITDGAVTGARTAPVAVSRADKMEARAWTLP
jgi:hypothetical protein